MRGEGSMLATTSYGAKILSSLGHTYELQADLACGGTSPLSLSPKRDQQKVNLYGLEAIQAAATLTVLLVHCRTRGRVGGGDAQRLPACQVRILSLQCWHTGTLPQQRMCTVCCGHNQCKDAMHVVSMAWHGHVQETQKHERRASQCDTLCARNRLWSTMQYTLCSHAVKQHQGMVKGNNKDQACHVWPGNWAMPRKNVCEG